MIKKMKRPLAFLMSLLMIMTFSFSDGLLGLSSLVYADESSSDITGKAVEPTKGDGSESSPYEIENYDNLVWFQQQVNEEKRLTINAKLTADIIANKNLLNSDGTLNTASIKYTWSPICPMVPVFIVERLTATDIL